MIKKLLASLAGLGGIKRRGLGALNAYGGKVEGAGRVVHKSGERAGEVTEFTISGSRARKTEG